MERQAYVACLSIDSILRHKIITEMKRTNPMLIGYVAAIISALAFGTIPMIGAFALDNGVTPLMLAFLRHVMLVPIFAVVVLCTPNATFRISLRQFLQVTILAIFGALLTTGLLFTSYAMIDTGIATTLNFTYPVFVLLLGAVFYRDVVTKTTLRCFALCMTGICLLCSPGGTFSWIGFFLALGSGIAYGIYTLYLDKSHIMQDLCFSTYTFYFFLTASILLFPTVWLIEGLHFSGGVVSAGYVLLFGLGGLLATIAFQLGVKHIGSQRVSLLCCVEPVTSVVLGVIFLSEPLTLARVIGSMLILLATGLLALSESRS